MALAKLYSEGILKQVTTQNVDSLHLKSGVPRSATSELHGNVFFEYCQDCFAEYERDFRTRTKEEAKEHLTGRKCMACGGELKDNLVHFGDQLPKNELVFGLKHALASDLVLCVGSSL